MIGAYLRRGLVAGALAGVLAGLTGQLVGEPSIDAAVRIEQAAGVAAPGGGEGITRAGQKGGLLLGMLLVGLTAGAAFAVVAAWSAGRVAGDGWTRSLKLGAAGAGALVLLPLLKYPPNPPAVGDPATVGDRALLQLGVVLLGLVMAALGWAVTRQLAGSGLSRPVRQAVVGAGIATLAAALLLALPAAEPAPEGFPPELLWRFRLGSVATQLVLIVGLTVAFGLLTTRAERTGATTAERTSATT